MIAIVIAVRDFLIVLALGWLGVTVEPADRGERQCASRASPCQTMQAN